MAFANNLASSHRGPLTWTKFPIPIISWKMHNELALLLAEIEHLADWIWLSALAAGMEGCRPRAAGK